MFEFTARLTIEASAETVWQEFEKIDDWWVASNPEHESLEILSTDRILRPGMRIRVKEKIAGIPGVAEGVVTEFEPGHLATWEADATYQFLGLSLPIHEGVTWRVEPAEHGETCELSAHVWADFSAAPLAPAVEWIFKRPLRGVKHDYEHAMRELRYLKRRIEGKLGNN